MQERLPLASSLVSVPSLMSSALADLGQSWVKGILSPIHRSLRSPTQPSAVQKLHTFRTGIAPCSMGSLPGQIASLPWGFFRDCGRELRG